MRRGWLICVLVLGCGGNEGAEAGGGGAGASRFGERLTLLAASTPEYAVTTLATEGSAVYAVRVRGSYGVEQVAVLDTLTRASDRAKYVGSDPPVGVFVDAAQSIWALTRGGRWKADRYSGRSIWQATAVVPVALVEVGGHAVVADEESRIFTVDPSGATLLRARVSGTPLGMVHGGRGVLAAVSGTRSCADDARVHLGTVVVDAAATPAPLPELPKIADARCPTGHLAIDESAIYWTQGDGRVLSVSRAGGPPVVLAHDQDTPLGVAVDDEYVYWTERGHYVAGESDTFALAGGAINRLRKATGRIDRVPAEGEAPFAIVVTPRHVVWSSARGGGVYAIAR